MTINRFDIVQQYLQQMLYIRIIPVLCITALLLPLVLSDCNLNRFPNSLYFSSNLSAESSIEEYVVDEYPEATSDFAPSIQLQQTYSSINTERFIEGYAFPFFVKVKEDGSSIQFELWNLTNNSLQNTSIRYSLQKSYECRFFSLRDIAFSDILIHCENATHHRQYAIWFLFNQQSQLYLLRENLNGGIASTVQFLRMKITQYSEVFSLVRKNKNRILQLYRFESSIPYSSKDYLLKYKDWVQQQTQLKNVEFIGYFIAESPKGSFEIFHLRDEGILFGYLDYYFDQWKLKDQIISRVVTMINSNIFAVFTEEQIYFLSVEQNERNQYRLVVKEIAKVGIKGIGYSNAFNIGQFIVLAGNQVWNVFYLTGNDVKFFKFPTSIMPQDITFSNSMSTMNSFLIYNQLFLLRKPSIKIRQGMNKLITLKTSQCTHNLIIKCLTSRQIEIVNDNLELIWRNRFMEKSHALCQGNNVSQSIVIGNKTVNIPKLSIFSPNIPKNTTQIMNFTMINTHLFIVVIKVNFVIHLLSCFKEQPCKIAKSYEDIYTPQLINEARLNVFNISEGKGQKWQLEYEAQSLQQQLLLTIVWNMSKLYFTDYKILANQLELQGGWESPSLRLQGLEMLSYSPTKKQQCTKNAGITVYFVAYVEKWVNNWAHYKYQSSRVQVIQRQDLLFGYKNICSISNVNMKFLLYDYEGSNLKVRIVYDKDNFYQEIGFVSFDKLISQKAVCSKIGLVVTNGSEIIIISEDLAVVRTIKLSSNTQDDKISGSLLLHKRDPLNTEIYNLNTGFLLQSIPVSIDQIKETKQTNMFALKNNTFFFFNDFITFPLAESKNFGLLNCSNDFNFSSKIKRVRIINDLQLPQAIYLDSRATIDHNIWMATVRNIKGVTKQSQVQQLTHFRVQEDYVLKYLLQIYTISRKVLGKTLQVRFLNDYCMRERQSTIYYISLQVKYGSPLSPEFQLNKRAFFNEDTYFGLTNLYENKISIASWNESSINFLTLKFDTKNISNVKIEEHFCSVSAWIQDEYYITKRIIKDKSYVYLLRYEIQSWKSTYVVSNNWKERGDLPRRQVTTRPKIQIFTLEDYSQCSIQEITSESLGFDQQIKDFMTTQKNNSTFIFILTNSQIIIFNFHNRSSKYSAKLGRTFEKMDLRNDQLLLVSESDDSQLFRIEWKGFPFVGSLQLMYMLTRVQEKGLIGGVIMSKGVVLASRSSLLLYPYETNASCYLIQAKSIKDLIERESWTQIFDINYKDNNIIYVDYISPFIPQLRTIQVTLSFELDISKYEKLIVSNEMKTKEYIKKVMKKPKAQGNLAIQ